MCQTIMRNCATQCHSKNHLSPADIERDKVALSQLFHSYSYLHFPCPPPKCARHLTAIHITKYNCSEVRKANSVHNRKKRQKRQSVRPPSRVAEVLCAGPGERLVVFLLKRLRGSAYASARVSSNFRPWWLCASSLSFSFWAHSSHGNDGSAGRQMKTHDTFRGTRAGSYHVYFPNSA